MAAECALCGEVAQLKDSHIIPRFVLKYIKISGATPFLTKIDDPENRFQDHTEELLCGACEQKLNQFENPFAGHIFYPYVRDGKKNLEYSKWLQKFIISVDWRIIKSELSAWEELPAHERQAVISAKEIWIDILRGDKSLKNDPFTHHIILLDDLDLRTDPSELPEKWEFYRGRAVDATVTEGIETHYYFKFPGIAFISCIQPTEVPGFRNTRVYRTGEIGPSQSIPREWESFLLNRVEKAFSHDISDKRHEQITEWIEERPERAIESKTFQTWAEEMERKIENHDPTDYLTGRECPICFTDHRVIESLPERPINESEAKTLAEKFVFFKPIYIQGKIEHPNMPNNIAPTIVFSTEAKTFQIALYTDIGWVVEKEIELSEGMNPEKIGEMLWNETRNSYAEFANKHR
ncbi:hypothetical protein [Halobaculum sp. EA56]|uniref:hypothetical protein n=1 Tax=Halobaculum sp. EA56 TaxID=3421648 RepID=UPI003EBDF4F1